MSQMLEARTVSHETARRHQLYGRRLLAARIAWVVLTVLALAIFAAALPGRLERLLTVDNATRAYLTEMGMTVEGYSAIYAGREIVFVLAFALLGVLIFWRRSNNWVAILTSATLITFGASFFAIYRIVLLEEAPPLYYLSRAVLLVGFGGMVPFLYLFPDGRFVPRWTRYATLAWVVLNIYWFTD